jgi:glycosyltransferase involved in cell wall biosynthesis
MSGQRFHEVLNTVHVYRFPAPPPANGVLGYLGEYGYSMAAAFILSLVVFVRDGFDVVHGHNPPDTFVFIAAFYKVFGVRYVFDHHDLSPEMYNARFAGRPNRLISRALVLVERLSCRLADRVIATNESYKAVEMQRGPVPPDRITVVRNGPDLNRVRTVEPDPVLRGKGKTIIGFVGVMGYQDGIDYLLRALRHLMRDLGRTDFFCVLIGTGDALASMKALATECDLDEHVWFTGPLSAPQFLPYLCAADICVDPDPSNPYNDRCTMVKIAEYMALAKPVVAFDLPEHRVTAEQAAVYVRPSDELEFARALANLMDDPDRRAAMGAYGRQRVESALTWAHSTPHLLQAYEALFADATIPKPAALRERTGTARSV